MMQQAQFKISLVGNTSTGKTQFIRTLNNDKNPTLKTIGCQHTSYIAKVAGQNGPKQIRFSLWDCGGSRQYQTLIGTYTKGSDVILLFCSPYEQNTIEENRRLISMLKEKDEGPRRRYIVLVRSIRKDWEQPDSDGLQQLAHYNDLMFENVDAKDPQSVKGLINKLTEKLYKERFYDLTQSPLAKEFETEEPHPERPTIQLAHYLPYVASFLCGILVAALYFRKRL